jgi:hypothetical protein
MARAFAEGVIISIIGLERSGFKQNPVTYGTKHLQQVVTLLIGGFDMYQHQNDK